MTRTPRLAVDMDQVIVDTLARYQIWYARDFGAPLPVAALVGKGFKVAVPEAHQAQVQSYAHHPDFFRDLTPFVGSIDVLRRLAQRY
ncbi:MAG: 5' nucleotidase, NT5C type, partial [Polyangiales bacterium]